MTQAVVLGLGSMFNHSAQFQNVGWERDLVKEVVVYKALRDIQPGEELCESRRVLRERGEKNRPLE